MSTKSCSVDAEAPSLVLPLPLNADVRLFAGTADNAWLARLARRPRLGVSAVAPRCLHPDMRRGDPQLYEWVVAGGAPWAEPTFPSTAPTAMRRPCQAGQGTS